MSRIENMEGAQAAPVAHYCEAPRLRFPGFEERWTKKRLSELGRFRSGTAFPEHQQGGRDGIPFYKVSDMNLEGNGDNITSSNNYVTLEQIRYLKLKPIKEHSLVFAKVGAAIFLERKRKARNFLIDNNMMAFTPDDKLDFDFVAHLLRRTTFSRLAQSGALPSYNASDIGVIQTALPALQEQQKIASFLSSIDTKIDTLCQKKDALTRFKTGLLQKIFSQEIRFTREDGSAFPEWGVVHFRDCIGSINIMVDDPSPLEVYSSTRSGLVRQVDRFSGRQIENKNGYRWVLPGSIVYRPMSDDGIFRFNLNKTHHNIAVTSAYKVFHLIGHDMEFIEPYLNHSPAFLKYLDGIRQGGTRLALPLTSLADFSDKIPCVEEQCRISKSLADIEIKITSVNDQITQMESFKKGLLQQMFV